MQKHKQARGNLCYNKDTLSSLQVCSPWSEKIQNPMDDLRDSASHSKKKTLQFTSHKNCAIFGLINLFKK